MPSGLQSRSSNTRIDIAENDMLVESGAIAPNDSGYSGQWYLPKIQVPDAREMTAGEGVTVAVLDSVGCSHPELVNSLVPVRHVVSDNADTSPVSWHGTSAAGTVAATGNNTTGLASVAGTPASSRTG